LLEYGWDCEGCECPGDCACVNDYSAYGAADCDAAWDEYGVNCADLAADYAWDCENCCCPGDVEESSMEVADDSCQGLCDE